MARSSLSTIAGDARQLGAGLGRQLLAALHATRLLIGIAYLLATLLLLWPIAWIGQGLNWALARHGLWIGLLAVAVAVATLLVYAALMTNEEFLRALPRQGVAFPTSLSVALAAYAVIVFGAVSCASERLGWLSMQPSALADGHCATHYADLYLWHLMDALPGIKFNETVGWVLKYSYSGALAGWLLVGFKLLVIVAVIGSFVVCGRLPRAPAATPVTTPPAPPDDR